jgi:ABC-type multidrug transport system fused ATPase/permease subunit
VIVVVVVVVVMVVVVVIVVVVVAVVVLLLVVIVVVVVVVVHFSPKFIYISEWQQHTSRLQTSTAKAIHEEHKKYNNNASSNASLPSSFCLE